MFDIENQSGNEFVSELLDLVAKNITDNQMLCEKDYLSADGLLMCGNCCTKKQTRLNLPKIGEKILPISCKCHNDRFEAGLEKQRLYGLEQIRKQYIDFEACRKYRFEQDDGRNAQITQSLQRYADKFREMLRTNTGIILHGGVGTGKTFYAGCIANELIDKGYSVVMTSVSRIVEYTDSFTKNIVKKDEYTEHLKKCDCLILDDLATERDTEYMNEKVYNVINMRYQSGKPLIVTTNATKQAIVDPRTIERMRIYDRLIEMCKLIEVSGETRRIDKANHLNMQFDKQFC